MSDLIKVLRSTNDEWQLAAADEIERLTTRIAELEEALTNISRNSMDSSTRGIAFAALKEQSDNTEFKEWYERQNSCSHPNSAHAPGLQNASIWCPDCKQWVIKEKTE